MDKREEGGEGGWEGGREGGIIMFFCQNILSHSAQNFVEDSFCVRQKFWYRKLVAIRGGASITIFRQIVLSHSTESSRRGMLLCFIKFRVSEKTYV